MSLKQKMNTPLKRTAFIVLLLSTIIFIISLIVKVNARRYYDLSDVLIYSLTLEAREDEFSFMVFLSFYLSVISTVIVFLYDSLVLKIINWIKTGEKQEDKNNNDTLYFKDNISAFEYICRFGNNEIKRERH